jgi:hypothetical protein
VLVAKIKNYETLRAVNLWINEGFYKDWGEVMRGGLNFNYKGNSRDTIGD